MTVEKQQLCDTGLPILQIDEWRIDKEFPKIGYGDEGNVYEYNKDIVLKIYYSKKNLRRKFEKIELLGKMQDDNASFPIGLVGYESGEKEGYYSSHAKPDRYFKDFSQFAAIEDKTQKLKAILEADAAIRRFHQKGLILGDIRGANIMVSRNNKPIFIDTDNWMIGDYGFDILPYRTEWLEQAYRKKASLIDNDRFVFAIMALQMLIKKAISKDLPTKEDLDNLVESLPTSKRIKKEIKLIFSDARNKPYIGDILREIYPEEGQQVIARVRH